MATAKAAYLSFDGSDLYFDAVVTEQTEHSTTVTEHPVEQGANIADHVRDLLDRVTLDVFVSNSPIADVNSLYGGAFDGLELDVPKVEHSIAPTPGALFSAVAGAVAGLLSGGDSPPKATVLKWPSKFDSVKDTMDQLLEWKKAGTVGKVILPWKTFPSMVIVGVKPRRTAQTGDGAQLTIELKEIRVVESKLVTAPKPTEPRAKIKKPKGVQGAVEASGPKKSVLKTLADKLRGK